MTTEEARAALASCCEDAAASLMIAGELCSRLDAMKAQGVSVPDARRMAGIARKLLGIASRELEQAEQAMA